MQKLTVVAPEYCDQMLLKHVFATGHWTNAYAELFGTDESSPPTHLHIYNRQRAAEAFKLGKLVLPASVVTVSYPEHS